MQPAKAVLVDARNFDQVAPKIIAEMSADTVGFDIETFDNAHEGIVSYRTKTKLVFDVKRTVIAGFSLHARGADEAYYVNLNHADVENRVPWEKAKTLMDAIPDTTTICCHNAPFELTMMGESLNYEFGDNIVCTLQLAVSAYGPDEYPQDKWVAHQLGDMKSLMSQAAKVFATWQPGDNMTPEMHELMKKATAKESTASHSYNGFIRTISYGYGLKQAVKSWFNYDMATFEETLGDKEHMGFLTGEEVVDYGADDAFWCVELFYKLLAFMTKHCPQAIKAWKEQENPMIHVYSRLWREGLLVNEPAIHSRQDVERANYAQGLRDLKTACKKLLPLPVKPHEGLARMDKWYVDEEKGRTGYVKQRKDLETWILSPNVEDDFQQCCQVSSAVPNAWAGKKCSTFSIQHYYKTRMICYDLLQMRNYVIKGKTASDGDARGNLKERIAKYRRWLAEGFDIELFKHVPEGMTEKEVTPWLDACDEVIDAYNNLASIEQRVKLYITPYLKLTDPETDRMYPVLSSKLASRRMAMSYPNGMQLSKRGESTYVRGFYEPDEKDEVLIALDWSQIELVLIGEMSGDPEFAKAYGQTPYEDLHLGAAADVLSVVWSSVDEEMLANADKWSEDQLAAGLLVNSNGVPIAQGKRKGYWRTTVGKGSNFNYWYSGALSTVGQNLGWTSDQMWEATEKYRQRFAVAEAWRVKLIEDARFTGYVELPDGHRRYREEVTHRFQQNFGQIVSAFNRQGTTLFGNEVARRIKTRAGNQLVNSMIQGSCATLAKRSILNINHKIAAEGWRARFKMPIHDELVFSVHKDEAADFITMAKKGMCYHPEIISKLAVDSTASIGLTFEPWEPKKAPIGQIEIDEAPDILGFTPDSHLNKDEINATIDYLFKTREAA